MIRPRDPFWEKILSLGQDLQSLSIHDRMKLMDAVMVEYDRHLVCATPEDYQAFSQIRQVLSVLCNNEAALSYPENQVDQQALTRFVDTLHRRIDLGMLREEWSSQTMEDRENCLRYIRDLFAESFNADIRGMEIRYGRSGMLPGNRMIGPDGHAAMHVYHAPAFASDFDLSLYATACACTAAYHKLIAGRRAIAWQGEADPRRDLRLRLRSCPPEYKNPYQIDQFDKYMEMPHLAHMRWIADEIFYQVRLGQDEERTFSLGEQIQKTWKVGFLNHRLLRSFNTAAGSDVEMAQVIEQIHHADLPLLSPKGVSAITTTYNRMAQEKLTTPKFEELIYSILNDLPIYEEYALFQDMKRLAFFKALHDDPQFRHAKENWANYSHDQRFGYMRFLIDKQAAIYGHKRLGLRGFQAGDNPNNLGVCYTDSDPPLIVINDQYPGAMDNIARLSNTCRHEAIHGLHGVMGRLYNEGLLTQNHPMYEQAQVFYSAKFAYIVPEANRDYYRQHVWEKDAWNEGALFESVMFGSEEKYQHYIDGLERKIQRIKGIDVRSNVIAQGPVSGV